MKVLIKILKKKNQTGFSLIELMIVVVIIGILSTIAVPQYQNFQKKAKQSEAKANLSGLYTTLKTFQAEWNQFYGDFRALGYDLAGNLQYNVGFSASHVNGPPNHPDKVFRNKASVQHNAKIRCVPAITTDCRLDPFAANKYNIPATKISPIGAAKQTFTAGAIGNIDNDPALDTWTINDQKFLEQTANDISQ